MKRSYLIICLILVLCLSSGCTVTTDTNSSGRVVHPNPNAVGINIPENTQNTSNGITSAYTKAGQHPENLVIDAINRAKSTLDIAIYSFTHPGIAAAIIAAKNRGVAVRMITDRGEYKNSPSQTKQIDVIRAAGIIVKQNTHSGLMHLKVSIIDRSVMLEGSFNYTIQASTQNDEGIWKLPFPQVALDGEAQFERMWNDTKGFAVIP